MPITRNAINAVLACLLLLYRIHLAEDHAIFLRKQIIAERFTVSSAVVTSGANSTG